MQACFGLLGCSLRDVLLPMPYGQAELVILGLSLGTQMLDDRNNNWPMTCKLFAVCSKFMNKYAEIGRHDIRDEYIHKYCTNNNQHLCKRKQYFVLNDKLPDDGLTPTGNISYIQRVFLQGNK